LYYLFYIDSIGQKHQVPFEPHSYPNLMELIRDQGFEDWGDCRARTWCATCHVNISIVKTLTPPDDEEQVRLDKLTNVITSSRLACQISLDKKTHQSLIEFIGAD